jgi:hypothetical protein
MSILSQQQVEPPNPWADWWIDDQGTLTVPQTAAEIEAETAAIRELTQAALAAPNRCCLICCEPIDEPRYVHSACAFEPTDFAGD